MVGRFIGTVDAAHVQAGQGADDARLVAVGLVLLVHGRRTGQVAMWSIIAVGLFNSIMFPTIFTLAIDGLGKHTEPGLGHPLHGDRRRRHHPGRCRARWPTRSAFTTASSSPAVCYVYIAWYGLTLRAAREAQARRLSAAGPTAAARVV